MPRTELLLQVKCEMIGTKREEIASSIYTRYSLPFLSLDIDSSSRSIPKAFFGYRQPLDIALRIVQAKLGKPGPWLQHHHAFIRCKPCNFSAAAIQRIVSLNQSSPSCHSKVSRTDQFFCKQQLGWLGDGVLGR